jgi:pimeloyl-ACP methyl ester carboxylesterase
VPTAVINGADIHYETMGDRGRWLVVNSGGRHSLSEVRDLSGAFVDYGYRVLLHDRRNCGQSSLDFDFQASEDDVWVDDLHSLLVRLSIDRPFLVGKSRTARMAIRFALRYPDSVRGIGLWGLGGGPAAVRFLDEYYYQRYVRACKTGGMEAVCATGHFAGMAAARPENREMLLAMNPNDFLAAILRWRSDVVAWVDNPLIGFDDNELRRVAVPTAIVPYYDAIHPHATALHAHTLISGSEMFDFDSSRPRPRTVLPADVADDTVVVARILSRFEQRITRHESRVTRGQAAALLRRTFGRR